MTVRLTATAAVLVLLGPGLLACSSDEAPEPARSPASTSASPSPDSTATSTTPDDRAEPSEGGPAGEVDDMRIQITVGNEDFQATLDDSAASRDLLAQLPVTLQMSDHGSVEKTGPLPSPLSLEGQPGGADPDLGDLGYYAPGNDLVLYYGDQSYFSGIVILGEMDAGAAEGIAAMEGDVTVTVSALGG